jgi:hypothetical protein
MNYIDNQCCRRVGEVEDERAAGTERDKQPDECLAPISAIRRTVSGAFIFQAVAAVAFDQPFDQQEEIGPDRLRTGEAAPHAAGERIRQDQDRRSQDHQPGDVVELLRPDLDEETVEAPMFEVEQDGLVQLARPRSQRRNGAM